MRDVMYGNNYNGYSLSDTSKNDEGFYVEILIALEALLNEMTSRHDKVFFIMLTLKYPSLSDDITGYPNNNSLLSDFLDKTRRFCKAKNYDPLYLWVRELSSTGQFHYHLVLLLNGNLIQNAYNIKEKATKYWQNCLHLEDGKGLVHLHTSGFHIDKYGGIKILRAAEDFQEIFEECIKRGSYLAKCYSKGNSPPYVNEFGCSRIPMIELR